MAEYIKKDDALKCCTSIRDKHGNPVARSVEYHRIRKLEPEDVRPLVPGRWERKCDGVCYWSECSNCGEYPPKNRYGQEWLSGFCPSCGAVMKGE